MVWDSMERFCDYSRTRNLNWIFEGTKGVMQRYKNVESYSCRLRNKQAETLRLQVEVLAHMQLPAQLYIP